MVSTGIAYHSPVSAATTTDLATATSGTITYAQPNGAANGIGATLTTTGSFNLIDTANVQTIGTRILVQNEGNTVFNGVYTWANATVIVRATDADQYGPDSTEQLSINDYFFVQNGTVNKGAAFVVSAPPGTITFGTSGITFSQFSSSQTYTANTNAGISLIGTQFNTKVDNDTTAFDAGGNIIVKAGANLTTPNIGAATGTSLSLTGNAISGNVLTGGLISATGNITGGNITSVAGQISTGGNVTGGNVVGFVRPTTGTAAQAPIRLTAGTNVSSPVGGAIEYDGVVLYATATDGDRGVLATEQFIALVSDYIANDSASAQKVFNSPTNGAITLDAATTYMMEGVYYITRGLGSNSHTLGVLFALGGSLTSITYTADTTSTATYALGAVSRFYNTTASLLTVTAASTDTTENITVTIKGIVRTNAAGTFTPQIQYSSAPGGAPTILKNSYFKMTPVGNSTVASVGNWS